MFGPCLDHVWTISCVCSVPPHACRATYSTSGRLLSGGLIDACNPNAMPNSRLHVFRCGNFDIIITHRFRATSEASFTPPHNRRATCSIFRMNYSDADWCLQPGGVPGSPLWLCCDCASDCASDCAVLVAVLWLWLCCAVADCNPVVYPVRGGAPMQANAGPDGIPRDCSAAKGALPGRRARCTLKVRTTKKETEKKAGSRYQWTPRACVLVVGK